MAPAGEWAAAVRAKAVLVEAARVLPEMTITLRSFTRHTYRLPERVRRCPALSARWSYRWGIGYWGWPDCPWGCSRQCSTQLTACGVRVGLAGVKASR